VLVRCTAPPDLVRTLVATPDAEVRGTAEGGLVAAMAYDGEECPEDLERIGRRLLAWLTATFAGAETVRVTGVEVGHRPMPADGIPIVGRLPGAQGVHVAVVHPGVQLAPVVGRLLAEQIATGVDVAELRDWSPARFVPG
jgi:glycine/D-amino acid oxidase-like deaminating enzyme